MRIELTKYDYVFKYLSLTHIHSLTRTSVYTELSFFCLPRCIFTWPIFLVCTISTLILDLAVTFFSLSLYLRNSWCYRFEPKMRIHESSSLWLSPVTVSYICIHRRCMELKSKPCIYGVWIWIRFFFRIPYHCHFKNNFNVRLLCIVTVFDIFAHSLSIYRTTLLELNVFSFLHSLLFFDTISYKYTLTHTYTLSHTKCSIFIVFTRLNRSSREREREKCKLCA